MALISQYAREINCLKDNQKAIRLPALQRLCSELPKLPIAEVQVFFSQHLKKPLLDLISDPVDKCRELSVSLLIEFAKTLPNLSNDATDIVETVARRLTTPHMAEGVEEIRLLEVKLVKETVRKWWEALIPALNDLGYVLSKAFLDPFPQVKLEAAELLELICRATGLRVGLCASPICAGALENLTHQHSKVRLATLHSLGVLFEKTGNCDLLKTLFPILKQKLRHDRTIAVRSTLYEVLRDWLLTFPYESLIYQVDLEGKSTLTTAETQLTYLLLSGLGDSEVQISTAIPNYIAIISQRRISLASEYQEDIETSNPAQFQALHILKDLVMLSIADCTEWTVNEKSKTRGAVTMLALAGMAGHFVTPYMESIVKTAVKVYTETEDLEQRKIYEELIGVLSQTCSYDIVATVLTKNIAPEQTSVSQRTTVFVRFRQKFIRISANSVSSDTLVPQMPLLITKLIEAEALAL